MKDMDVKATLASGDELILIGPVLSLSTTGQVIACNNTFSCWHNDNAVQVPISEIIKAKFTEQSIKNIELIIDDELPKPKKIWIGLLNNLNDRELKQKKEADYLTF